MVKIINGEIVSDDDPRVAGAQQRRSGSTGGRDARSGGGQRTAGYGRVASLLDPPSTSQDPGGRSERGGDGQGQQAGPLDPLAQAIGVHDRFVKIPGALGLPEKEVPLIYLMVAALMALIGFKVWGWKAPALMLFAYVLINQQGSPQPGSRRS